MSSTPETESLETWFRANDGYLRDGIRILHSQNAGYHVRADVSIPPDTTIASAPHSITLSYLNALVDDQYPVFRLQRDKFKIEAIGFFYLMAQYVNRDRSFWKPYLDVLPQPEDEFSQPLFYDSLEDITWLAGTDVWHTVIARRDVYRKYYDDGVTVLKDGGVDVAPYTWHLFKWSTAIFAARSFTSLALLSVGSKYRTAYKTASDGHREAVLLDVSAWPTEDLDFPVLFPGLDAANHSHEARVDWTFDPGRFSIRINDQIPSGAEVLNNYGPKGNGELLIGYGFCLPDNPYDTVALTPKQPPQDLQEELERVQPGYFTSQGDWSLEKATFRIALPTTEASYARQIFLELPEPLLELLLYMLRHERNLPFEIVADPLDRLLSSQSPESRYLPHIARLIAQFLTQKLAQLESADLPSTPQNARQKQAVIYRQGQIKIMRYYISGLRDFTRSLVWTPSTQDPQLPSKPCLVTLESLVPVLVSRTILDQVFMKGIQASANTEDLEQLRLAGWEEDIWALLWCYLGFSPLGSAFLGAVLPEYIDLAKDLGIPSIKIEDDATVRAESLLELVRTAASCCPDSVWQDERWSEGYIVSVGGRILEHESFIVGNSMLEDKEGPRLYVSLHSSGNGKGV